MRSEQAGQESGTGYAGQGFQAAGGEGEGVRDRLGREVKARVTAFLSHRKDDLAGRLSSVAMNLRRTGGEVSQDNAFIAGLTDRAAGKVEQLTDTIRSKEVEELIGDVGDYLRRHPAVLFGGALAIGFLAARLVRSEFFPATQARPAGEQMNPEPAVESARPAGIQLH